MAVVLARQLLFYHFIIFARIIRLELHSMKYVLLASALLLGVMLA